MHNFCFLLVKTVDKFKAYLFACLLLTAVLVVANFINEFKEAFPIGIYQYASVLFIFLSMYSITLMCFGSLSALYYLLLALTVGARLSEFIRIEIGYLLITIDAILIFIFAVVSIFLNNYRKDIFQYFFFIFAFVNVLSSIVTSNGSAITILICGVLVPFLIYQIIVFNLRCLKDVRLIGNALGMVILICLIFSFLQPILNSNADDFLSVRLVSVFYNPVIFAGVIVLLWPFLLVYSPVGLRNKFFFRSSFRLIGVFLSFAAVILTGSRGAMIIVSIQSMWVYIRLLSDIPVRTRRALKLVIYAVLIACAFNADLLLESNFRRFSNMDFTEPGNSASERVLGAFAGLELGLASPLYGVGLGNFAIAYPTTDVASLGGLELETAHNFLCNLFAEAGLPAVVVWCLMIFVVYKRLAKLAKYSISNGAAQMLSSLKLSFFGYSTYLLLFSDEFMHRQIALPMVLYFVVLALISSMYFIHKEKLVCG